MTLTLTPIGTIHCDLKDSAETPKNYTESREKGRLEIEPRYLEALDGIEPGQDIVVLFWLHEAKRNLLKVHPRGDRSRPRRGVFATRSPDRPNPIAISKLKVLGLQDNLIEVSGVDVFDKTPVLDIKSVVRTRNDG